MIDDCVLAVNDATDVGQARRRVAALTRQLAFGEAEAGRAAIVVTELATNLGKHAGSGELLTRSLNDRERTGLELVAVDRGPGIANIGEAVRDGHSTAGSPGTGLGAIRRLSDRFDIYSGKGQGTVVLAQVWSAPHARAAVGRGLEIGGICVPKHGEEMCGDGWVADQRGSRSVIALIDGLGHGPAAGEVAREGVRVVRKHADQSPRQIMEAAHSELRGTRGGAMAVAEIDLGRDQIRFSGLGNISGVVVRNGDRHLVSHNGTLGHHAQRIDEFTYPWSPDALLVLHSDGLVTHWNLERYGGLGQRHPSVVAAVLYRDLARGHDDVTVVVAREAA